MIIASLVAVAVFTIILYISILDRDPFFKAVLGEDFIAQVPFPYHAGPVSSHLQGLCKGDLALGQARGAGVRAHTVARGPAEGRVRAGVDARRAAPHQLVEQGTQLGGGLLPRLGIGNGLRSRDRPQRLGP